MAEPILKCMADVQPELAEWLWAGRIPLRHLTLLAGRPGIGKSFTTCHMAATVSTGRAWPDGPPCPRGDVLLISGEDDPATTIRPRLDAHGADLSRITLLQGVRASTGEEGATEVLFELSDSGILEDAIMRLDQPKLVIIDPIGSYLGSKTDAYRDNEVRGILAPIAEIAKHLNVAVLVVAHNRKSGAASADDTVMGSRAFTGIARSVLHVMPDPDNADRRLVLPGKCNLARPPSGLAYKITGDPPRLTWSDDLVGWTADSAMAALGTGEDRGALVEAADWLRDFLEPEPRPASEVFEKAKNAGHSKATIQRAKGALGVSPQKQSFNGPWVWALPDSTSKPAEDAQCSPSSIFELPPRMNGVPFTDAPF